MVKRAILLAVLSISILGTLSCATSCFEIPDYEEPAPWETPTPEVSKPNRNVLPEEIKNDPIYLNLSWKGRDDELVRAAAEIGLQYSETHVYIEGETDCNDMAIDIWNMLAARGITSIIVIGNLNKADESFAECNHAWLVILNSESKGLVLEPTNGEIYFITDVTQQYNQGLFYIKPSDLRADVKERW